MPGWEIDDEKIRPKANSAPGVPKRAAIAIILLWLVLFPVVIGFRVSNHVSDTFTYRTGVVLTAEGRPVDLTWFQVPIDYLGAREQEGAFTADIKYFDALEFGWLWLLPAALLFCLLNAHLVYRWVRWGKLRPPER